MLGIGKFSGQNSLYLPVELFALYLSLNLCMFVTKVCLMFLQGAILTTILATSNFNFSAGIIMFLVEFH